MEYSNSSINDGHVNFILIFRSRQGRGNVVPLAEFNYYHDPEAVFIILNNLKCPTTIVPLETDENLHITMVCINVINQ